VKHEDQHHAQRYILLASLALSKPILAGESQDVRERGLDGSAMIYKVVHCPYYNATGTTGDQRYA